MAEEKKKEFEVIFAIVNNGFADQVMLAAKEAGAKGGTIIRARGSSDIGVDKKYGLTITPEKELLMILTKVSSKDKIMDAIYKADLSLETANRGIVFSLPVDSVVGLKY